LNFQLSLGHHLHPIILIYPPNSLIIPPFILIVLPPLSSPTISANIIVINPPVDPPNYILHDT
jgi:hypothetical protein